MNDAAVKIPEENLSHEETVRKDIIRAIKTVFDPEIPSDVYELGLIYGIGMTPVEGDQFDVHVRMTLTSPHCPSAAELPESVRAMAQTTEGVRNATIEVVWEPTWDRSMMSEEAKLNMGFF